MIRNLRKLFALIILSVLAEMPLFAQTQGSIKNVFWQPNELQPGSVTFFTVELNREATKVSGQFLGKDLLFFYSAKARVWYSLAGVDVETTPGTYELRIRAALPGGRVARTVKSVEIGTVTFGTGDVNVPENFVKPDEASQKKIAADQRSTRRTPSSPPRKTEKGPINIIAMLYAVGIQLASSTPSPIAPRRSGRPTLITRPFNVAIPAPKNTPTVPT